MATYALRDLTRDYGGGNTRVYTSSSARSGIQLVDMVLDMELGRREGRSVFVGNTLFLYSFPSATRLMHIAVSRPVRNTQTGVTFDLGDDDDTDRYLDNGSFSIGTQSEYILRSTSHFYTSANRLRIRFAGPSSGTPDPLDGVLRVSLLMCQYEGTS